MARLFCEFARIVELLRLLSLVWGGGGDLLDTFNLLFTKFHSISRLLEKKNQRDSYSSFCSFFPLFC